MKINSILYGCLNVSLCAFAMEKPKPEVFPIPTLIKTEKLTLPITVNFTPDGTKAVIGAAIENDKGVYGEVFVYDSNLDTQISKFSYPYAIDVADISPDNQNMALTNMSNPVQMVSITDGKVVATVPNASILPNTIQYNKAGNQLLLADPNGVYIYDIDGQAVTTVISGYSQNRVAYFKPDNNNIIAIAQELPGSSQNGVQLWDIAAKKSIRNFKPKPEPVYQLAFNQTGDKLVCGQVSYLSVWDTHSGQETELLNGAGKLVSRPGKKKWSAAQFLAFIPGKNIFFAPVSTQQNNGIILACDIDHPEDNISFGDVGPDMSKFVGNITISPNGQNLLVAREAGDDVCLWDISSINTNLKRVAQILKAKSEQSGKSRCALL